MSAFDDYLNNTEPAQRAELEKIRRIVKKQVPDSKEAISYGIPTFKYKDMNMLHFAAFKDHMSIFPGSEPIAILKDKLTKFTTSKGTIQFKEDNLIPENVLIEIVLACKNRIDGN